MLAVIYKRLLAEGADNGFGGFGSGKILLSCNQVAIADGEAAPQPGLNIIGPDRLRWRMW